jgi:hypothetical protein
MPSVIAKAYFCPKCHSPSVSFSNLSGVASAGASCDACGWKGEKRELVAKAFQHEMGSEDEVLQRFTRDFRNMLAKECLLPISKWLNKWGFLPSDPKEQQKALIRYTTEVAKACITSILQTRHAMEKEHINVS